MNLTDVDPVSHVARDVEAQSYDVLALKPDTHCFWALGTDTESRSETDTLADTLPEMLKPSPMMSWL